MNKQFKRSVKKFFLGISLEEEYVCIEKDSINSPSSVYLSFKSDDKFINVTQSHILLGYKPLLIAVFTNAEHGETIRADEVCMNFTNNNFTLNDNWKGFKTDNKSVATLALKKIHEQKSGSYSVFLFEGILGKHHFISPAQQTINNLYQKIISKGISNVHLKGNLYDQVRIAYSIPRTISLITLKIGSKINVFPTDLHGNTGNDYYISSLRLGGKAGEQVELAKQIVISDVELCRNNIVYQLGKNHMKDPQSPENFDLMEISSEQFRLALPTGTVNYRELMVIDHFDIKTHRIFIYKVMNEKRFNPKPVLSHVHAYYIQWLKNNFETPHLLPRSK